MYALSHSVEVNPPGETVISPDQMWKGLVMKAEDAVPFVPLMEQCRVVERYADGFLREVRLRGAMMRERITLTPPVEVFFERVDPPSDDPATERSGWITNVISNSDRGLLLSFTFALSFPGIQPGSEEERARGEAIKGSYIEAVVATLAETRRRVREGRM